MRIAVAATTLLLLAASGLWAQTEAERWASSLSAPRPRGFGVAGHQTRAYHNLPWYYTYSGVQRSLAPDPRYLPLLANGPHTPMPDCAKYGSPRECKESDPQVARFLDYHEQFARDFPSKTYLVFNEPGRPEQGNQDPVKSAWLYDEVTKRMRGVDPSALFYCCGTAPSICGSGNPGCRDWMKVFASTITQPVDGIHVHGYHGQMFSSSATIQGLIDFSRQMQGIPAFRNKEIVISEWAGLSTNARDACQARNARDHLMRPVAAWLNGYGAWYRYRAAAWWMDYCTGPWCGAARLFSDTSGRKSCLGNEYFTYQWGKVPGRFPGSGNMQATSGYIAGSTLVQGYWRGNQGWVRYVPLKANGSPDWNRAGDWLGPQGRGGLPGSGNIQALTSYVLPNKTLQQGLWRGDQGWSRTVPLRANGTPDWGRAGRWNGPISLSSLPGLGSMQAQTAYVLPNKTLQQSFWRGNQGWVRIVPPRANGSPDWGRASSWHGPVSLSSLPGSGSIQAQTATVFRNRTLVQGIWRSNQGWSRTVPLRADGTPDWGRAGAWNGPISLHW